MSCLTGHPGLLGRGAPADINIDGDDRVIKDARGPEPAGHSYLKHLWMMQRIPSTVQQEPSREKKRGHPQAEEGET